MVWIHGGGFVAGSGGGSDFSGASFAKENVILVSINYRLGRLGFFAFPALSKENPKEYKGNYAYMDQIAALQWVQKNIAQFGGDPKNVTIFGESAGGVSVHSLLTIPSAKGLFQKAIIESGGGRDGVLTGRPLDKDNADRHYPLSAETIGLNFAKRYKIEGEDKSALEKLRKLSAEEVIDGGQESTEGVSTYSGPILDGKLVTETAESSYNARNQSMVPIIIGSNSAEVPAGFVNASSKDELFSLFGDFKDEAKSAYDADGNSNFNKILSLVNTDKVWAEPARFTSRIFTSTKQPAYLYLFSYVPEVLEQRMPFGAGHASEIPYVFNNLIERNGFKVSSKDKEVAALMNSYWINFAKNGNPNGKNLPEWPVYNEKKNEVFEFKKDGSAENTIDSRKQRLDVIEKSVQKF
jgi:para-nitrobenzyl esterase